MAARRSAGGRQRVAEVDPYLAPATPPPPPAGLSAEQLATLRARRDRALAREEARRAAAEARRRRPDLF